MSVQHREQKQNIVIPWYGNRGNYIYHGENLVVYIIIKSVLCASETNIPIKMKKIENK